jgi:putative ABC transport system substrate-binding protein
VNSEQKAVSSKNAKLMDRALSFMRCALCLLGALLLPLSFPAGAQQPKKIPTIGWIAFSGSRPNRDFMTGLRERGYIEGQSITIEYRSAQGQEDRLSEIAAELVRSKVDVIVANSNATTDAAKKATTTIPIVFGGVGDPVGDGIVADLARPGGNITGISAFSFELAGKRLELLRDAFPKISRVAVLLQAGANHRRQFADMQKVAQALGVQLQALEYQDLMLDFGSVLQQAVNQRADAFVVLLSPIVVRHRARLVDFAAKNRLPAIYPSRDFADAGGLMSYGVDFAEVQRRAAYYVDRILKGAKPADLPVERPTKFELVINLETAHQIGATIPAEVLTWADRVVSEGRPMSEKSLATTDSTKSQRPKIPRVGVLAAGRETNSFALAAVRQGLHDLGYVEGHNIILEFRSTGHDEHRVPVAVAELLRSNVDVVVADSSLEARAMQQLTRTIPIVTTVINNSSSFVDSLHRPGGNVTGFSYIGPELNGKRLELLKEIAPDLSRVAILATDTQASRVQAVARSLGLKLQILNASKPDEIENAFASIVRGHTEALSVFTTPLANRQTIVDLMARLRLPAIYPRREFVETGGLMSYGLNHTELNRRAAFYVDKILKGAKPAEFPVEQLTKAEFVINLKTAKELGLAISPEVLMGADRVIK